MKKLKLTTKKLECKTYKINAKITRAEIKDLPQLTDMDVEKISEEINKEVRKSFLKDMRKRLAKKLNKIKK